MQIIMERERFCFQGQVWELEAFWDSLRQLALSGVTVQEYLQRQLH